MKLLQKLTCFFKGHVIFPLALTLHVVLNSSEEKEVTSVCRRCGTPIKIIMRNSKGRIDYEVK